MDGGRTPIKHGDTTLVDQNDKGTNNTPVVARLANGRLVCKLLRVEADTKVLRLASTNPEHLDSTPTAVPPEDISEIIGRVVRIIHDL